MKKSYSVLLVLLVISNGFWPQQASAQTPQKISYQTVIRNASNVIVVNTLIGVKISILSSTATGTVVYTESKTVTTNANGIVNLEIGGNEGFSAINWGSTIYFIKIETDLTGGITYSNATVSQLLSMPYALHAKRVENVLSLSQEQIDALNPPTKGLMVYNNTTKMPYYYTGTEWRSISTTKDILITSADSGFMRNGKAYHGIGVNYFNAFYRTITNNNDTSYSSGLKYLGDNKIPFIRFSANGFWPNELKLYQTNKTLYFSMLDKFVKCAEINGVGLIPSLFWYYAAVPDLMGEHINQWGNPDSKTIAFMRTYTAEIVSRYKDSPAIWGWEFGNEVNAYCDLLDQAINYLPLVNTAQGTPATRTIDDAITTNILKVALTEFTAVIKMYDPNRPVFSGNTMPSSNMYHRYKYQNWIQDSSTDFTALLDAQNPASLGTLTIHTYPDQEFKYFSDTVASLSQIVKEAMRSSIELKRSLFIGEFGSPISLGATVEAQKFQELLEAIIVNKVQLSALWVFDFTPQDAEWNVTSTNSRKYQLDAIINANTQINPVP